jgi:predicted RNA methylase
MLSQWFTPPTLALRLAEWAGRPKAGARVLEPSAGGGALCYAVLAVHDRIVLTPVEVDDAHATALANRLGITVECCDYLRRSKPSSRYDLCIMNPPYEDGLDGAFIAKAMDESDMIVALCRLNVVVSKARYESVWSRVGSAWELSGLAFLVQRPSFLLAGRKTDSPLSDFVAFKLVRSRKRIETRVEWWQ